MRPVYVQDEKHDEEDGAEWLQHALMNVASSGRQAGYKRHQ
jgi:hypothetical protein